MLLALLPVAPACAQSATQSALDSFMNSAVQQTTTDTFEKSTPLVLDTTYKQEDIKKRSVSESQWDKATKGLDYGTDKKKEKKKEKNESDDDGKPMSEIGSKYLQVLAFGVMILLLALLIIYIFRSSLMLKNTAIKRSGISLLEDLEENLQESDLERALREALEQKDFRLALRIYYLAILKEMSLKNWIVYKRDKTNYEYVRELGGRPSTALFRDITYTFERFWYGDIEIGETEYKEMSPVFSQFIDQLRAGQHG